MNNQISVEFVKDSIDDPYLFVTTRLMRLNYNHFKPFKDHSAVVATQKMSDRIGTGVYLLGLFQGTIPDFTLQTPVSKVIMDAIHPDPDSARVIVKEYFNEVEKFYHESHFEDYFAANAPLYLLAEQEAKRNLPGDDFIPTLEAYYGASKNSYTIIVMPSFKSGWGMAWEIVKNGKPHAYNIAAPFQEQKLSANKTVMEAGFDNPAEIRNLAVHEFGHTFVNPLTALPEFEKQINSYQHLFKPIPGQGQYSDWVTVFNEHVVRAGEIRIALALGQEGESKRLQGLYKDWMYLPHFVGQLKKFEMSRKQFKSFEAFLPELIASLEMVR